MNKRFLLVISSLLLLIAVIHAQAPVVATFSPTSAGPGATVIIAGANLTGVTSVSFGGVPAASFTVVSATAITAVVGSGESGSISVTNASGTGSLAGFTYVAPPPTISSFSPTSGVIGTIVTINGTNFNTTPSNNIVYFGSVTATVLTATSTKLTVSVPAGATYQPISVTTANLTAYSFKPFVVTFSGGGSAFNSNTFAAKTDLATNSNPIMSAVADMDGDGKLDIVVSNQYSYSFSIFRNTSSSIGTVSFANKLDFSTNYYYNYGICLTDLDGDGKQDVISTNYSYNMFSVYRNTSTSGNLSMAAEINTSTGTYPVFVRTADFDGDGKPDIVIGYSTGTTISVYLNTSTSGNISFGARTDITVGSYPSSVAIGDIDGDGKKDIIACNQSSSTVSVLRNISTGIGSILFASKVDYATGTGPRSVAVGDMDGDGKLDIVVANYSSTSVSVIRNLSVSGALSFASKIDFSTGTGVYPSSIGLADIDGDGKVDIISGNSNSSTVFSAFRNTSVSGSITASSFSAVQTYTTGNTPSSITLGDFDADGKSDVVTANLAGSSVSVLRNQVGGPIISSFTPSSGVTGTNIIINGSNFTGATAVTIGGVPATSFTIVSSTAIIAVLGNGSTGSVAVTTPNGVGSLAGFYYTLPIPVISSFSPASGVVGTSVTITGNNFNTTASSNIVYFGAVKATVNAATATSLTVTVPVGATYQPISVTNNTLTAFSAKPFIVTFSGGGASFLTGSFASKVDYTVNTNPSYIAVADLDGDGKSDVLTSNGYYNSLSALRNITKTGVVSFAPKVDFTTNGQAMSVCVVDLDGDGKPDVATTNYTNNSLAVFKNNSKVDSILLSSETDYPSGTYPYYVAAGDFDGDGKPDLIVANYNSYNISVFRNLSTPGNILFDTKIDIAAGYYPVYLAVADIDGDGKVDIISADQSANTVSVYRNTSTGYGYVSFATRLYFTTGSYPRSVAVGDIDGDGKPDLLVGNYSDATVSVLRNTSTSGSVSFAAKTDFTTGTSSGPSGIVLTDLDGDGKLDVAVSGQSTNVVAVLRNKSTSGAVSLETNVNYVSGAYPTGLTTGDIDGDGKPDIVSANTNSSSISLLRNQTGEPLIASFSPTSGVAGTTVIINGANFNNVTSVSFGGTPAASFTVVSSNAIVATVDSGSSGNVTVIAAAGTANLGGFSYITPVPSISSFTPTSGPIGTVVTISGANFGNSPTKNIVYFGAVKATITAATSTSITVKVPAGASYQPITVTTNGLTTNTALPFNVKFPGGGSSFSSTLFSSHADSSIGSSPRTIALADFDGDGKTDFLYTNSNSPGNVTICKNTTSGKVISYTTSVGFSNMSYPIGVAVADLDGDGKLDFAVSNYYNNTVAIFRNTSTSGNISFDTEIDITTVTNPLYLTVGDLDNDGRPDLVVSGNYSSNIISVMRNTSFIGSISFAPKSDFTVGSYPLTPIIADLNGDGLMDIAVPNYYGNSMSVLKNTSSFGSISFASKYDYTTLSSPEAIVAGDVDGDGKIDLVVSNYSTSFISVYRNLTNVGDAFSASSFSAKSDFATGSSDYGAALGDLDGDGKPDIAVCNTGSGTISLLRNKSAVGSVSFDTKLDVQVGSQPLYIAISDMDGDGKPDIVTSNYSGGSLSILRNQLGDPVITSFTPTSGTTLGTVIINGSGFVNVSSVSFGGVPASSFTVISSTAIIAYVGNGASGLVKVTTSTGSSELGDFIYIAPPPTINSFAPTNATTGTTITITGTNLSGATSVSFGGIAASSYTVVDATTITAILGAGATGNVSVITPGGNTNMAGFTFCTPATSQNTNISGCNSIVYKGVTYTASASISDTIKNTKGCDSVYKSVLISITTPIVKNVSLNGCNSLVYKGGTYTNSAIIKDTIKSNQGCDSVYNVVSITINKLVANTQNTVLSGCNAVVFNGITYTNTTVLRDTIKSSLGCDSIYKVTNINVNKITVVTQNIKVGGCNSVVYNGITYLNSTTKTDTIKSYQGCDSVYKVASITVSKITPTSQATSLNGCNSVLYNGNTYVASTVVKDTVKSIYGCDSIYKTTTITVYKLVPVSNNINLSGCNSVVYNGITYTVSTTKNDTIRGLFGCDSIYKIAIINVTKITPISQNIKVGGCNSVVYNGITYTVSTVKNDTIKSVQGCDSIYKIATISVTKITPTNQSVQLSGCTKVVYNSITYTNSTVVKDTIKSVQGCDSIYKTTTITIYNLVPVTNNITLKGCNSVVYNGNTYTSSTTKNDTIRSIYGCDSIYKIATITVTKIIPSTNPNIITGCDSVLYNQRKYYASTVVNDTIRSLQGCDSIFIITTITIKASPVILNVSSNTPVALGDTIKLYATATSGTSYSWTGPLSFVSSEQNPLIPNAVNTMTGTYSVTVTDNGCSSTSVATQVSVANAIYTVSGRLWHPKGFYVKDINVNLTGNESQTYTTDAGGFYTFKQASGNNFKIQPQTFGRNTVSLRNKDRNEVSTLDLALIQSHILQKSILNSPYKMVAADVNNDGKISTLDIVYMKRIILGLDTSYSGNKLWAIVDSSFTFANPLSPFPHKDSIKYANLASNQVNQTYTAVILGDVNWSATSPKAQMGTTVQLYYDNIIAKNNDLIRVPVRVNNFKEMLGMQFTLSFNPEAMKYKGIANNILNVDNGTNHAEEGKITFLWNDPLNEMKTLEDGSILFELLFEKKGFCVNEKLALNSAITNVEAFDKDYQLHNLELLSSKINSTEVTKDTWIVAPNPSTNGVIKVQLNCIKNKAVQFKLIDFKGSVLLERKVDAVKGDNYFIIDQKSKLPSGLYYLQAVGLEGEDVKKILIL